uniref:Protein FAM221A n=1 Tax=Astyanax mexicanus TaxID=7994 RepID=A0A8B9HL40_ASTMX
IRYFLYIYLIELISDALIQALVFYVRITDTKGLVLISCYILCCVRIVGEDDGGKLFSEAEYEEYKRRVLPIRARNRLYVSFGVPGKIDCKLIGPETPCFCNTCTGFLSPYTCGCGEPGHAHVTLVETRAQREARGLPVGMDMPYAAMGGLTGFSSLAEGYLRLDPSGSGNAVQIYYSFYLIFSPISIPINSTYY